MFDRVWNMPLVSLLFSATWTLHKTKKIDVLGTVNVKTEYIAIVSKLSSVLVLSTKNVFLVGYCN